MLSAQGLASRMHISQTELRELATQVANGEHYQLREVRKADGSMRVLFIPDEWLGMALKKGAELLAHLKVDYPDHVHGFVRGRSIVTNALPHLAKKVVLRVDLKDFFPSITFNQVHKSLLSLNVSSDAASAMATLATVHGKLPVGFHTSPLLSNLVFESTDSKLAEIAAREGFSVSRYVDDITFSGDISNSFLDEIRELLHGDGWTINDAKTLFMKKGGKQFVTGLSVADHARPRLPLASKRRMRWKAHFIGRHGFETYLNEFGGEVFGETPARLLGMAFHMRSVEPNVGDNLLAVLLPAAEKYWEDRGEPWVYQEHFAR